MSAAALALDIAVEAFEALPECDQFDRGGRLYVAHFRRVANRVDGDWTKAVAWLHDTLEDTPVTAQDLEDRGVGPVVIDAVLMMTHDPSEPYRAYVDRLWSFRNTTPGRLAYQVKIADLCDNLDVRRSAADEDDRLRRKHQPALDRLLHGRWLDDVKL